MPVGYSPSVTGSGSGCVVCHGYSLLDWLVSSDDEVRAVRGLEAHRHERCRLGVRVGRADAVVVGAQRLDGHERCSIVGRVDVAAVLVDGLVRVAEVVALVAVLAEHRHALDVDVAPSARERHRARRNEARVRGEVPDLAAAADVVAVLVAAHRAARRDGGGYEVGVARMDGGRGRDRDVTRHGSDAHDSRRAVVCRRRNVRPAHGHGDGLHLVAVRCGERGRVGGAVLDRRGCVAARDVAERGRHGVVDRGADAHGSVVSRAVAEAVDQLVRRVYDVDHECRVVGGARRLVVGGGLAELDAVVLWSAVLPVLVVAVEADVRHGDALHVERSARAVGHAVHSVREEVVDVAVEADGVGGVDRREADRRAADRVAALLLELVEDVGARVYRAPVERVVREDHDAVAARHARERAAEPELLRGAHVLLAALGRVEADDAHPLGREVAVAVPGRRAAHDRRAVGVVLAEVLVQLGISEWRDVCVVAQAVMVADRAEVGHALCGLVNPVVDLGYLGLAVGERRGRAPHRGVPAVEEEVQWHHVADCLRGHARVL